MSVVEAHATLEGYTITARLTAANGAKLVYTVEGKTFEEAQARMMARIDELLPPEKPEEPA